LDLIGWSVSSLANDEGRFETLEGVGVPTLIEQVLRRVMKSEIEIWHRFRDPATSAEGFLEEGVALVELSLPLKHVRQAQVLLNLAPDAEPIGRDDLESVPKTRFGLVETIRAAKLNAELTQESGFLGGSRLEGQLFFEVSEVGIESRLVLRNLAKAFVEFEDRCRWLHGEALSCSSYSTLQSSRVRKIRYSLLSLILQLAGLPVDLSPGLQTFFGSTSMAFVIGPMIWHFERRFQSKVNIPSYLPLGFGVEVVGGAVAAAEFGEVAVFVEAAAGFSAVIGMSAVSFASVEKSPSAFTSCAVGAAGACGGSAAFASDQQRGTRESATNFFMMRASGAERRD
jgi:hypothetical protein